MKIRSNFVSNSSSASFVLKPNKKFKTVYDVAKTIMLEFGEGTNEYEEELKNLEKYKNKPDTPVYFPTSDGTYIRKVNGLLIVSTTQHLDTEVFSPYFLSFDKIDPAILKSLEYEDDDYEEYEEESKLRTIDCFEDFDFYWKQFEDFVLLPYDVVGVLAYLRGEEYGKDCPYCGEHGFREGIKKNGKIYCTCQVEKLKRKEKLIKIKHESKK